MLSRYFSLALLVVLAGAVIYIAWQLTRVDSHRAGKPRLEVRPISLEQAVENSQSSTVRSDAVISVESCRKAQDEFLRGITSDITETSTPEEIEDSLQSILGQLNDGNTEVMHLTCLMHQYPVTTDKAGKSKSS